MVKKLVLMMVLLTAVLLAACGGGTTETAVPAADIDVASLPATIDVQTVDSVKDRDDVVLIDVREQWEYDEGHIPGITLIPMNEVPARLSEIPTDKTVILTCRSGNRSGQVAEFLRGEGYDNVHNMEGGIIACDAPRHPFPALHPAVREGLLQTARRLDPLALRWGR